MKLQWDEKGISEYDKERGHHMIISEPKTPYHPPPGMEPKDEEDEAINPNDLAYKLEVLIIELFLIVTKTCRRR